MLDSGVVVLCSEAAPGWCGSLCLLQEGSLSHSTICVCPPRTWAALGCAVPPRNADTQMQQSQLGYTWMMFTYPNFGALFSSAA